MARERRIVPTNRIESRILLIRKSRVVIDADLAEFYGVATRRLNEQVKRNTERFPIDFVFQLTQEEKQEVVANCDHLSKLKYSNTLPFVFTEQLASIVAAIRSLLGKSGIPKKRRIGFEREKLGPD